MFGIVMSALWAASGWLVTYVIRGVVIKFIVFTLLFYIVTEFVGVLMSSGILPSASKITDYTSLIPPSVDYFLTVFSFYAGLTMILSAYVSRFIIRRLPFIG